MKSFIITKWIEPYVLLETIKKSYSYKDFTFNGQNKIDQKMLFLDQLKICKFNIGLYMKNVNKFYLFSRNDYFDIQEKLINTLNLATTDYEFGQNIEKALNMVDLAKAEAVIIFP